MGPLRRWRERYQEHGYDGLYDRRKPRPSPQKVALETGEKVVPLYGEKYFACNVRHCHEKLAEKHGLQLSYRWVKWALQTAQLVSKRRRRGKPRRRRPRRPMPGMLLPIDASKHAWFGDGRYGDLIPILDDATSEIYYGQLVEEEGTRTLMPAVREGIEKQGIFCARYSDRASHFLVTPQAGGKVDESQGTPLGRALQELGIKMIPGYSPQARGRMERSYGTWQGRFPQELRWRGIDAVEAANRFLREAYLAEFKRRFMVKAVEKGSAFVRTRRKDLGWVLSIQQERRVNQDNTSALGNRVLPIEKTRWRDTLAGCSVTVYEWLEGTVVVRFGPHEGARFGGEELPEARPKVRSAARPLGHKREQAA